MPRFLSRAGGIEILEPEVDRIVAARRRQLVHEALVGVPMVKSFDPERKHQLKAD